jgi:hypothetical protein
VRTTNGLNVPTGWGQRPPVPRRSCPVCHRAITISTGPTGHRMIDGHRRKVDGKWAWCPGSDRLVDQ